MRVFPCAESLFFTKNAAGLRHNPGDPSRGAGGAGAGGVVWWGSGVLRLSNIAEAAPEGHVGLNAWPPAIFLHRPLKKKHRAERVEICGHVFVKICGHSFVQICGHVLVQICGHSFVQLCGQSFVQICGHVLVQNCGHVLVEMCGRRFGRFRDRRFGRFRGRRFGRFRDRRLGRFHGRRCCRFRVDSVSAFCGFGGRR